MIVGEEISTRGGHLLGLFLERPVPALQSLRWSVAAVHEQGGIAIPAHPLVPYPLCAQGFVLRRPPRRRRSGRPARRDRDVQPHGPRAGTGTSGSCASRRTTAWPRSATAIPTRSTRSGPAGRRSRARTEDDLRAAILARHDAPPRRLPRHDRPAGHVRAPAAQVRRAMRAPRWAAGSVGTAPGRDHGYPGGHLRPPRFEPARRRAPADEDRARLALRLPAPRRGDPARPLPVREPPPARARRPDPDLVPRPPADVRGRRHPPRQGLLDADQRLGRDDHGLAALRLAGARAPRSRAVRRAPLPRAVRALPLARHPARVAERQHRHLPRLRRLVARLRVRLTGDAGLRGPAPRPDRRVGGRAPLHRPLLPGRLQGDPQRRRHRPLPAGRAGRALAGRDGEHPVRRAVRAAQGRPRPAPGLPDPAQDRLPVPAAARRRRTAGARGPPLRRDPPPARRRVPGPRLGRREGAAVPDRRRLRRPGHRPRVVRDRAARGDGGRRADRRLGHPRLQGRRAPGSRGAAGAAARSPRRSPARSRACSASPRPAAAMAAAGARARGGVQLAAGDGEGRGVLRVRDPPPGGDGDAAGPLHRARAAVAEGRAAPAPLGRPSRPDDAPIEVS